MDNFKIKKLLASLVFWWFLAVVKPNGPDQPDPEWPKLVLPSWPAWPGLTWISIPGAQPSSKLGSNWDHFGLLSMYLHYRLNPNLNPLLRPTRPDLTRIWVKPARSAQTSGLAALLWHRKSNRQLRCWRLLPVLKFDLSNHLRFWHSNHDF